MEADAENVVVERPAVAKETLPRRIAVAPPLAVVGEHGGQVVPPESEALEMLRSKGRLDNPEEFSEFQLLRIVNAAVRTGVIGTGATSSEGVVKLGDDLKLDFNARETMVLEENDCDGGIALLAIASMLGDSALVSQIAITVGKVC